MWSSAAVAHLLQGPTCCVFRDALLHTLVETSGYLSYCCLHIILNRSGHSPTYTVYYSDQPLGWVMFDFLDRVIILTQHCLSLFRGYNCHEASLGLCSHRVVHGVTTFL